MRTTRRRRSDEVMRKEVEKDESREEVWQDEVMRKEKDE